MKRLLLLWPLLLLGCASVDYKPFEGNSRPLKGPDGVFVDTAFALPVYTSAPPKPFFVIGRINITGKNRGPAATTAAVRVAKSHGAEGLIDLDKSTLYGGLLGGFAASPIGPNGAPAGASWSAAAWLERADFLAIQFVH